MTFPFLGMHASAFVFEDAGACDALAGRFMLMSAPGRQAGFYPIRGGRVATFFAHRMPEARLPASPVQALEQHYGHLGWLIPTALRQARQLSNIYYDSVSQVRLTRWSFGRIALVGDACQAVSLVAGQGASLAMNAAHVLSEELLNAHSSIEEALARYETRLRPLIERKQQTGKRLVSWFVPRSRWQAALRNLTLNVADHAGMSWILRPLT